MGLFSKKKTTTTTRSPWDPAVPFITEGLAETQRLAGQEVPEFETREQATMLTPEFIQGAIRAAGRPAEEQFLEVVMPSIAQSAIGAGGAGSTRQGVAEGIAAGKLSRNLGDIGAQMQQQFAAQQADEALRVAMLNQAERQFGYGAELQQGQIPFDRQLQLLQLANQAGSLGGVETQTQKTSGGLGSTLLALGLMGAAPFTGGASLGGLGALGGMGSLGSLFGGAAAASAVPAAAGSIFGGGGAASLAPLFASGAQAGLASSFR